MEVFYHSEELRQAKSQRKKCLIIFYAILCLYLIFSAFTFIWYRQLPYKSPTIIWVKVAQYSVTGVFVIFSFIYLTIKFRRVNKYKKILEGLETGLRETTIANFSRYSDSLEVKDGADFKSLIFLEWNKKRQEYLERKVLIDYEKKFPEFNENDVVKFVTQANILVEYEIIKDDRS